MKIEGWPRVAAAWIGSAIVSGMVGSAVGGVRAALGLKGQFEGLGWGLAATVFVVLAFFFTKAPKHVAQLYYTWKVAKWAGIVRVFPVIGEPSKAKNHQVQAAAISALVDVTDTKAPICVLLASGWFHIGGGKHKGVLLDAMQGRVHPTKVLLLDPDSEAAAHRAEASGIPLDSYLAGLNAVLWSLNRMKTVHGVPVEVRLYQEAPIWQMIIAPKDIWLFHGRHDGEGGARHADTSPIYCLRRGAEFGLAPGLEAVWERRWNLATPFDLSQVSDPEWRLLTDKTGNGDSTATA